MENLFRKQIDFKPEIKNKNNFPSNFENVVIGGMGGSALAARALFFLDPIFPAWLHNDYGIPKKIEGKALCIAISYSGNTRETISFVRESMDKKLPLAIITSGGKLLAMAQEKNVPYITVPEGMQPRDAVVFMLKSLLAFLGKEEIMKQIENTALSKITNGAEHIAEDIKDSIPLSYSSTDNGVLGYIWKINFNENAKMPAWNNVFPELTHNEIQGMSGATNDGLSQNIKILMLLDEEDGEENKRGMKVFEEEIGTKVKIIPINLPLGKANKLLATLILARETTYLLAKLRNVSPENVAVIETFKKKLAL